MQPHSFQLSKMVKCFHAEIDVLDDGKVQSELLACNACSLPYVSIWGGEGSLPSSASVTDELKITRSLIKRSKKQTVLLCHFWPLDNYRENVAPWRTRVSV